MSEHWDEDYDPQHPDLQHEVTADETDDPADTEPYDTDEPNPGELPDEISEVTRG